MAIAASGAVSFSDLRTEFSGAGAISFSNLYRGGTLVKGNAANNTATNLAASVPASGTINFTNFRGAARGWRKTYSSGAENQSASAIFGTDYGIDYPKEIVINSGVTLGATSTSDEALEISTGGVGSITITNNGTIIGKGGASNSVGGDAFEAFVACTFINNGFVYAGGGGGGNGGNGGGGRYTSTSTVYKGTSAGTGWDFTDGGCTNTSYRCGSFTQSYQVGQRGNNVCACKYGSGAYRSGTHVCQSNDDAYYSAKCYKNQSSTTNTSGGSGGSGGRGAGYNQTVQSGSSGSNGGQNAGSGGSGGSGGGFGANGSNGNSGANGNRTNGSSGGSGKSAGKYIRGISFVTFTNNGTVAGGTA